jgi:serine protease
MNRTRLLLTSLCALGLAACQDTVAPTASDEALTPQLGVGQQVERVVPGQVIVRLAEGTDMDSFGREHGASFSRLIAGGRMAMFTGAAGNERSLAARMKSDLRVIFAEPNYLRQPTAIDANMWSLDNDGSYDSYYSRGRRSGDPVGSGSTSDVDVFGGAGVPSLSSSSSVAIASIDTGVEKDHGEFGTGGATVVDGYDYYSNDPIADDTDDHGTHTTGTMVGRTVGVAGAAGLASNVTVYAYRVCGQNGCPTDAIVSAIVDATQQPDMVAMNLSLGGGSLSDAERVAIQAATDAGILVIAAAGNGGTNQVSCPACDPNAVSVAATNWVDELSYYSDSGPGLDISAPGGELYSNTTSESGIYSSVRNNGYAFFQGTSMATPHVTGAAAVISLVTGDQGDALRGRLLCSSHDIGASGYDETFGHGRLDVVAALQGSADVTCLSGGGGGTGGGGGGGGGGGEFSFDYAHGKSKGKNAVRIDALTSGTPGTLLMTRSDGTDAISLASFDLGTVYSTEDKGSATYDLTVCSTAPECTTVSVVYN